MLLAGRMPKKRDSPEEIVEKLRQVDVTVAQGAGVPRCKLEGSAFVQPQEPGPAQNGKDGGEKQQLLHE